MNKIIDGIEVLELVAERQDHDRMGGCTYQYIYHLHYDRYGVYEGESTSAPGGWWPEVYLETDLQELFDDGFVAMKPKELSETDAAIEAQCDKLYAQISTLRDSRPTCEIYRGKHELNDLILKWDRQINILQGWVSEFENAREMLFDVYSVSRNSTPQGLRDFNAIVGAQIWELGDTDYDQAVAMIAPHIERMRREKELECTAVQSQLDALEAAKAEIDSQISELEKEYNRLDGLLP